MPWVAPILQLVTAGGFGALAWYLIVRHLPTVEKEHREERATWMAYNEKRDNEESRRAEKNIEALVKVEEALKQLAK